MPLAEIVHQSFSPSNVVPKAVVGPPSSMRRIVVTPSDQQNWDAPSQAASLRIPLLDEPRPLLVSLGARRPGP